MILRIHRLAVVEIDAAVDWYEARRPGLGTELEDEIDSTLGLLLEYPLAAPPWRGRTDRRVAILDRFPFTLPYQVGETGLVVLALAHTSRHPGYWARRR